MRLHDRVARVFVVLSLACALPVARPAPGRATLCGQVKLLPREGVTPQPAGHALYRSRELRDAKLVDYARPGFAVVYAEGAADDAGVATLEIQGSRFGIRIEPEQAAVGRQGSIVLRNASSEAQVVSCPELGVLERMEPGAERVLSPGTAGAKRCAALGHENARATVFVAPGPYTVIAESGRFTLANLAPGHWRVGVWHPRFPSSIHEIELAPDVVESLTLEIGVGEMEEDR